jgi:hypothetical protein
VLRGELEAEKRKSMGIEEYANKKLRDYERAIKEESLRKQNAERAHAELGQRN